MVAEAKSSRRWPQLKYQVQNVYRKSFELPIDIDLQDNIWPSALGLWSPCLANLGAYSVLIEGDNLSIRV